MNHKEFLTELCKLVNEFSKSIKNEDAPCFCGHGSIVARCEIERDIWRTSPMILADISEAFEDLAMKRKVAMTEEADADELPYRNSRKRLVL